MKTGTFSLMAKRCSPATWSECSCVIRMAEISSARSPSAFSRLKVSRPDRPASTRMRVVLVATSAQFPRLPLASTDTDTAMDVAYPEWLWKREGFFAGPVPLMRLVIGLVMEVPELRLEIRTCSNESGATSNSCPRLLPVTLACSLLGEQIIDHVPPYGCAVCARN